MDDRRRNAWWWLLPFGLVVCVILIGQRHIARLKAREEERAFADAPGRLNKALDLCYAYYWEHPNAPLDLDIAVISDWAVGRGLAVPEDFYSRLTHRPFTMDRSPFGEHAVRLFDGFNSCVRTVCRQPPKSAPRPVALTVPALAAGPMGLLGSPHGLGPLLAAPALAGTDDEAIAAYRHALRADERLSPYHGPLAVALARSGRLGPAIEEYGKDAAVKYAELRATGVDVDGHDKALILWALRIGAGLDQGKHQQGAGAGLKGAGPPPRQRLRVAWRAAQRLHDAIAELCQAIRLKRDCAQARVKLRAALAASPRPGKTR